jgi:hypothetical protein
MELTDKTLIAFEKWYIPYIRKQRPDYIQFHDLQILRKFHRMIDSMKIGVFVDFFESAGIYISNSIMWAGTEIKAFTWFVGTKDKQFAYSQDLSIRDAQTGAIDKSNELFNDR